MGGEVCAQDIPGIMTQFPKYLPTSLPYAWGSFNIVFSQGSATQGPPWTIVESPFRVVNGGHFPSLLEASLLNPREARLPAVPPPPSFLPARVSRFVLLCSCVKATLHPNPHRRHKLTFYYVYLLGSLKVDMQI